MNWKDASRNAFLQQLDRNLYELNDSYPPHWDHLVLHLGFIQRQVKHIIDIGCGVGAYYALIKRHFPELHYSGYDYSKQAIDLAHSTWRVPYFYVRDYKGFTPHEFKDSDVIVANALCDVCEDGDACLEKLLSLQSGHLIIQRVRIVDNESYAKPYRVYGEIDTFEFYHNEQNLYHTIKEYGYTIVDKPYYQDEIIDLLLSKAEL